MSNIVKFDEKSLSVALKAIVKGAVQTRDKIQEVATWAIAVSITSGDVSVANALYDALGGTKSLRKDSLVAHFEKFGNFAWLKAEKKFAFFLNAKTGCTDGTLTPEYEAIIVGAKWDEAKREAVAVSVYDMESQVRIFISKMEKLALDPAITIENRDALDAVVLTFNRHVAEKTLKACTALDEAAQAKEVSAVVDALPTVEPQLIAA